MYNDNLTAAFATVNKYVHLNNNYHQPPTLGQNYPRIQAVHDRWLGQSRSGRPWDTNATNGDATHALPAAARA